MATDFVNPIAILVVARGFLLFGPRFLLLGSCFPNLRARFFDRGPQLLDLCFESGDFVFIARLTPRRDGQYAEDQKEPCHPPPDQAAQGVLEWMQYHACLLAGPRPRDE